MTDAYTPYGETDSTRPGEPLPVGSHDPEVEATRIEPAGMPKAPDDLDRELANFVQSLHDTYGSQMPAGGGPLRPDSANVRDAIGSRISTAILPRSIREAILVETQHAAEAARAAAKEWADGVRMQQEGRDAYERANRRLAEAENALRSLDLWREEDEPVKAAEPEPIPDHMIR